MMPEISDLNTAEAFAEILGVTAPTASRIIKSGEVESLSDGRRRLVPREAVIQYLEKNNLVPEPTDHKRRSEIRPDITALSFFSGALGLDLGMEMAGIEPLLYCESDRKCRMTIDANRPDAALVGDITKVSADDARAFAGLKQDETIDVVFGGPPCQAFSTAGAQRAFNDSRGNVFLKYIDLAAELKPTYIVIENVRGLLSAPYPLREDEKPVKGGALHLILKKLEKAGYAISFNLYNAANFGAPQIRERVVIVGKRGNKKVPYLTPTHSEHGEYGLPRWRTFRQATEGLDASESHHTEFPEKRLKFFRMLKEGQYWKDLPKEEQATAMGKAYNLTGGKTGFYRRIAFDRPAPTLVTVPTMPATALCHPVEDRPLSVEEYMRIQGFPKDWIICGSVPDMYRQIGNAVPVALGAAIGQLILEDIRGVKASERYTGFPYSRYKKTSDSTWQI